MERIYKGRLQDFRRGLTRLKFKQFCNFTTGHEVAASVYCALIRAALNYRYRDRGGGPIPMTAKELALNPVFEFKERDIIPLGRGSHINGKRLRELFVTMIYAAYLDRLVEFKGFQIKGNRMLVGYPEDDRGIDTAIFITENAPLISDGKYTFRAIAGKSTLAFYIQVKEYYYYNEFQRAILYPAAFQVGSLGSERLGSYSGLVLIYVRSFCTINFKEVKADLARHGLTGSNIVIVGTEALDSKAELPKNYTFWDFKQDEVFTTPVPVCDLFHTRKEVEAMERREPRAAENDRRAEAKGEPGASPNASPGGPSGTSGSVT